MVTQLTPAEWLAILNNPELTHDKDIEILQAIKDLGGEASAGEITKLVGFSNVVSVNSNMRFYALRIAKTRKIHFSRNKNNKSGYRYWNFFFKGRQEGDVFIWEFRKNLAEAFKLYLQKSSNFNDFPNVEKRVLEEDLELFEGEKKQGTRNIYQRSRKAREICIHKYGYKCAVCEIDFKKFYGLEVDKGFINVHHLKPISFHKKIHKVDPIRDLRPVCPNCHRMLHTRQPKPYSIEELKAIMKKAAQAKA